MRAAAIWVAALGLFWSFAALAKPLMPWAFDWPKTMVMPAAKWISRATKWLVNDASFGLFSFQQLTRWISAVVETPYRVVTGLLSDGIGPMAPLSWLAVVVLMTLIGHRAGGPRLALLAGACFVFIAVFGQWTSSMITLASILIAVPIGVAGGMALGLAAYRWPWFSRAITPVLDLMQTIPVFAYLVPILILFGFGPVAAVIATVIYALPPMTRITRLSLQRVPGELRDLGNMIGCSRRQMTWKVMVPSAKEGLMVGVNQVIMLSLNMVIIASMIGAGGLGFDVLAALRRLDFGAGLEAGFAIVALAIALDRISQALAHERQISPVKRNGYLWCAIGTLGIAAALAFLLPELQHYPQAWQLSTGTFWSKVVAWININYFDALEAVKNALLLNVLIPVKRFLIALPWAGVALLLGFVGWRLQGLRLAMLVTVLVVLIAATGLWDKAMITAYLCGISVAIAILIGIPIGVIAAERESLWKWVRLAIDTLQTLPSFVYLMPAVMLFRVGDFTAMIAVVAYAVAPAIRYTALGLQAVDPRLIEAGRAMGCTNWQILTKIKLRLALPEIMLGLNQTVMFALSMLVITALVGTRDLGQEVYIALTKADSGRGLVAGLAVAFIAIIADRLLGAAAARARAKLGLQEGGVNGA